MKTLFLSFVVFVFLPAMVVTAKTDTGSAHNLIFKYNLKDGWYLSSRNLMATRDGFNDMFFSYLDLNIGHSLGEKWAAEIGYRHAWFEIKDDWRDEYRPSAILSYKTKLGEWSLSNRHRLEYRMFESGSNAQERFRYRNETRIIAPWEIGSKGARVFIEEEFFYEFTDAGFNFNWLTTGLRWKVRSGVVAKLGYRWQTAKFGDEWNHRHQLVTGLLFFF